MSTQGDELAHTRSFLSDRNAGPPAPTLAGIQRTLSLYALPHSDSALDVLRMRHALTLNEVPDYEQRVVLGNAYRHREADLDRCVANLDTYRAYEPERVSEILLFLADPALGDSVWATFTARLVVLSEFYFTDNRRLWADNAWRRGWDVVVLCSVLIFYAVSTYVNVLNFGFDTESEAGGGGGVLALVVACHVVWLLDLVAATQLATRDDEGRLLTAPLDIVRQKRVPLAIDVVALLPLDFIFLALGLWVPFALFRFAKYVKTLKTVWLFEAVNQSSVTPSAMIFFYQYKPVLLGGFWIVVLLWSGAVFHSFADRWMNTPRHFPDFLQSIITMTAALVGSPANIAPQNNMDRSLILIFMTVTLVFEGIVIAKFTSLLFATSVQDENLRCINGTLSIVEHFKVPREIQREVLSYQLHELNDNATLHMGDLRSLPERMQAEVMGFSKIQAVQQVQLFHRAAPSCQLQLAKHLRRRQYQPETEIVRTGDVGTEMFILTHGYADIVIKDGTIVANLSRGDFFGEVALFSADGKRMATVRALTYVDCWVLTRDSFLQCVGLYPEFLQEIREVVKTRGVDMAQFDSAVEAALGAQPPGQDTGDVTAAASDLAAAAAQDEDAPLIGFDAAFGAGLGAGQGAAAMMRTQRRSTTLGQQRPSVGGPGHESGELTTMMTVEALHSDVSALTAAVKRIAEALRNRPPP